MAHSEIEELIEGDIISSLDLAMFDDKDIANIILQRSGVLYDIPRGGRIIRSWVAGDPEPLMKVVADKGRDIVRRALAMTYLEYVELRGHIAKFKPSSMADIGCGYGFIDLFIWRDFKADLVLIDIEESENRNFGYQDQGAGYSNLATAKAFLVSNGVPATAVSLINPKDADLAQSPKVDVAVSLLSCGFHYPLSTYTTYLLTKLKPGGGLVVDIRERSLSSQLEAIGEIGQVVDRYTHMDGTNRTVIERWSS